MTSFKFPPPPPPPPKATSNETQDLYASQRGSGDNTRGGRGRGPGWQGRGRGNGARGGGRGGRGGPQHLQQTREGWTQRGGYNGQQAQSATRTQAPNHPSPSATFEAHSTPNAYTTHVNGSAPSPFPPQSHQYQSPTPNNNKRKRGERAPVQPPNATPKPKPPRAKAAPAPAVPSFGFSLPPKPAVQPLNTDNTGNKGGRKKQKLQLGLTQQQEQEQEPESENEEEDIDEEAALAAQLGVEGIAFEYNDQKISLQTAAEVAAWIKDRRKQFPTQQRIAEKAEEKAQKRAKELEFLDRVHGKTKRERKKVNATVSQPAPGSKAEGRKPSLDELRARVEESIALKRRLSDAPKPQTVDLGLGYVSDSASESGYSILDEESSVVSSSEESDDSDDDSDAESAPEETSSKVQAPPIIVPPPPPLPPLPAPAEHQKREGRTCVAWKRYGTCKFGGKCHSAHPPRGEKKTMSLYERLVEQEKEKADRLALDAIKWLGQNGFLG